MFAMITENIGNEMSQVVSLTPNQPSTELSVPSVEKNAYSANAATISGSTHATTTSAETTARSGLAAARSSSASAMPSTFCPITADAPTNTTVRTTAFQKPSSVSSSA